MKKLAVVLIAIVTLSSCQVVRYTAAQDTQLFKFTESVTIDSLVGNWVYVHDADIYRINKFNIEGEFQIGDSLHLSRMKNPEGIQIMYNLNRDDVKILD